MTLLELSTTSTMSCLRPTGNTSRKERRAVPENREIDNVSLQTLLTVVSVSATMLANTPIVGGANDLSEFLFQITMRGVIRVIIL